MYSQGGVSTPMRKIFTALLAVFLMLVIAMAAGAEEITYTGTVKGGKLNMREANSADSKSLGSFKSGTKVTVLENDGTWCKVQSGKKIGYMLTEYLDIEANYTHLDWVETKNDGTILTLREKADGESAILLQVMSGVKAERIAIDGTYSRIRIGNVFGWVETRLLTVVPGEFDTLMSGSSDGKGFDLALLEKAERDVGSPRMRQQQAQLPYDIQYPVLRIDAADEQINAWLENTLDVFEKDYQQNHAGERGMYTVRYKAVDIDKRYCAVLLAGQYTAGSTRLTVFLPINLDLQKKTVLSANDLFTNPDRLLFFVECHLAGQMKTAADGYALRPGKELLSQVMMGKEGLEVYFSAGTALPVMYGDVAVKIPYAQVAQLMQVESELICSKVRTIDPAKPMIALTFDDGPSEYTLRILRVLAQYDARATFCVQGYNVEIYPDIVKQAVAQGNEIASHTWNHPNLTEISSSRVRSQLQRTNDAVAQVADGYQIKVLRPPYGATNRTVRNICADLDMVIAHWQIDTLDWEHRNANKTYRNVMSRAKSGSIVLCHDIYENTAIAMEMAIPELIDQGYQLVTVSELLSFHKDGAKPGTVYSHLKPENIRLD